MLHDSTSPVFLYQAAEKCGYKTWSMTFGAHGQSKSWKEDRPYMALGQVRI